MTGYHVIRTNLLTCVVFHGRRHGHRFYVVTRGGEHNTSAPICMIIITWDIIETLTGKTQLVLKFSRTKQKSLVAGAQCGVPTSIPSPFVEDLWWTKWHLDRFLSEYSVRACRHHSSSTPHLNIHTLPTLYFPCNRELS
jgi:hypothetical protein